MRTQKQKIETKEKILGRVLPLFLVNNYESITIGLMENATHITRGTIYKYFENKEDIFSQAVKQYYDSPLNVLYAVEPGNMDLYRYWNFKINNLQSSYEYFKSFGILTNMVAVSHYIEIQATRILPSFKELIDIHKCLNQKYWTKVLKNTPNHIVNTQRTTYKRAGQIYHAIFLHLCSVFPTGRQDLPDLYL